MCQAVFLCCHLHGTFFEVRYYGEKSASARKCTSTETDGHPDRMHGYDERVQSIEPRVRLGDFFKHTPNHVPG